MVGEVLPQTKPAKAPGPKVFNCPECGAGVVVRAVGQTLAVVCRACGVVIDPSNENYQIIDKVTKQLKVEPVIDIGKRGKIHGVLWEVIGFMQRCDASGAYIWGEYLLFNPTRGFRWLMEFDGHWNYIVVTKERPAFHGDNIVHWMNKSYSLFHKGRARVMFVMGEFYWRVKVNEQVAVEDFICPPEILSRERSQEEVNWSVGEYLKEEEVRTAFQITKPMPLVRGIAPNQPSSLSDMAPAIRKYWFAIVIFLVLMQLLTTVMAKREVAFVGNFSFSPNDLEKLKVSEPFTLGHGPANLEVKLQAPVSNDWMEVNADLVNDETGETHEFSLGVEYYHGRDFDGSWSEGNQVNDITLSVIPDGKYHLNIVASGSTSVGASYPFTLTLTRDVPIWSNFVGSLLLISAIPIVILWRRRSFERSRWSTSDFSPYWSESTEFDYADE